MNNDPLITIIIPVKNGAATLPDCLKAIQNQSYKSYEVIILDSGSTDKSLQIVTDFSFVRIFPIPPEEFNHGTTRNYGVSLAKGDIIVMTVQDAIPSDEFWLEKMMQHFNDSEVVAVCGQQVVPHDSDKNPHEWFRSFSAPKPRIVQLTREQITSGLSPKALYSFCTWDNVNAMYRKSILLKHPFKKVSFGEDMSWAKEALLNGLKIVYDSRSRVYHYHHASYDYTYKRTFTVLYFTYKNFKYIRPIHYSNIEYLKVIYRNFKYKANLSWIYFNYRRLNAINKAYQDLTYYLSKGEELLDAYHDKICGVPPQGKQNT